MENLLKSSTNNFSFNIEANFGSKERHKLPYRIRYDIMVIALAKPVNIHSDSCYALSENTPENFPTIVKLAGKKKKKKNSHDLIVPKGFRKKRCSGLKSMSPTSKGGKRDQETSLPVLALTLLSTPSQVVFISFICWVLHAVSILISNIAGVTQLGWKQTACPTVCWNDGWHTHCGYSHVTQPLRKQ